jgi:hypothetical protein
LTQLREVKTVSSRWKQSFSDCDSVRFPDGNADTLAESKAPPGCHVVTPAVIMASAGDLMRAGRVGICQGGAGAAITAADIAIVAISPEFGGQKSAPRCAGFAASENKLRFRQGPFGGFLAKQAM